MLAISNNVRAMEDEIKIPDPIKDARQAAAVEAQRAYYYPKVVAAQQESGKILAHHYFTKELPKTCVVNCIAYPKALKFCMHGSNLPEAYLVVPTIKEWIEQVLTRAFQLRKTILHDLYVDNELFEAVQEINERIKENSNEMARFLKIQPIIEKFSTEVIVHRESPGHD